jgi:hypothetical protein
MCSVDSEGYYLLCVGKGHGEISLESSRVKKKEGICFGLFIASFFMCVYVCVLGI